MRSDLLALVDPAKIAHNLRLLRARCAPGTKICAPLKANAYGHGLAVVAPVLHDLGVEMAGVATLAEALELRRLRWSRPILVFGNVLAVADAAERAERIAAIVEHHLAPTVADDAALPQLAAAAAARRITLDVHLKLDSGMGRMGAMPDRLPVLVQAVRAQPSLRLAGIYTHFASADLTQRDLTARQLETWRAQLSALSDLLPPGLVRHVANTAATLEWPDAHFDMVRPGLGLYGYAPAPHMVDRYDLRPALRLVSHVTLVKELPAGHCVGYGQTFTTGRPTRLGIVPCGYADGFLRILSNNTVVGTPAGDAPLVGRVSMDQFAIDLTDLPGVRAGTEVVLIDENPRRPNSVASLAARAETIPYEVVCILGARIDRLAASHAPEMGS